MALILIVDDEIEVCSTLKVLLELKGHEVIIAASGVEAIEKMNGQIDIIITDVMMPGMDGFELCRLIKGFEKFRNIPIIMITSLVDKQDRIKGIEPGFDHLTTCHIITDGDGRTIPNHFDPDVLKTFAHYTGAFEEIYEKLKN